MNENGWYLNQGDPHRWKPFPLFFFLNNLYCQLNFSVICLSCFIQPGLFSHMNRRNSISLNEKSKRVNWSEVTASIMIISCSELQYRWSTFKKWLINISDFDFYFLLLLLYFGRKKRKKEIFLSIYSNRRKEGYWGVRFSSFTKFWNC